MGVNDMGHWEDVDHETGPVPPDTSQSGTGPYDTVDAHPFGGVQQVDGLVYSEQQVSPELQWQATQQIDVPLPPVRERPERPRMGRSAEPWLPGPEPEPAKDTATPATRFVLPILVAVLPLAVLGGLGWIVYQIMLAYGL